MADKNLEVINNATKVDNSYLEELMKKDMTSEVKDEFLNILKQSKLFLPVVFRKNVDAPGQFGFDIADLPDGFGGNIVGLFTCVEIMQETGLKCSAILIDLKDLAEILRQSDGYSTVSINPFRKVFHDLPIVNF